MASQAWGGSRSAVEDRLAEAVRDEDCAALQEAIAHAKAAGVGRNPIERATRALQRLTAQMVLKNAMEAGELGLLRSAIAKAKAANLEFWELRQAKVKLKELEVDESLRIAIESRQTGALTCAIQGAQVNEVNSAMLEQAQLTLKHLEAERALNAALQQEDTPKIHDALAKAERLGVNLQVVAEGRRRLKNMEVRPVSTGNGTGGPGGQHRYRVSQEPTGANLMEHLDQLLDVAMAQKESGVLRMAIKFANGAGLSDRARGAEQLLGQIEAQRLLTMVMRKRVPDPKKLAEAVEKAKGACLDSPDIEVAERLIEQSQAPRPSRPPRLGHRLNSDSSLGSSSTLSPTGTADDGAAANNIVARRLQESPSPSGRPRAAPLSRTPSIGSSLSEAGAASQVWKLDPFADCPEVPPRLGSKTFSKHKHSLANLERNKRLALVTLEFPGNGRRKSNGRMAW